MNFEKGAIYNNNKKHQRFRKKSNQRYAKSLYKNYWEKSKKTKIFIRIYDVHGFKASTLQRCTFYPNLLINLMQFQLKCQIPTNISMEMDKLIPTFKRQCQEAKVWIQKKATKPSGQNVDQLEMLVGVQIGTTRMENCLALHPNSFTEMQAYVYSSRIHQSPTGNNRNQVE